MKAALTCRNYSEGVRIYERLCNMNTTRSTISYTMAMKLVYGKLNRTEQVDLAFREAEAAGVINLISIAASIEAAASRGDWQTAAGMLDYAQKRNFTLDNSQFNTVLAACAQRKHANQQDNDLQSSQQGVGLHGGIRIAT